MANISINAYTLIDQPNEMTPVRADRSIAYELTLSSVAFFSWGSSIVGKEITLSWNYMTATEFASLDAIYQADTEVVFDPQAGDSKTYNVQVISLDGTLVRKISGTGAYRTDVKMVLLIMSEV
jgi:hypothetical protein